MSITGPSTAVDGTSDTIIGVGMSTDVNDPVELVASRGVGPPLVLAQVITGTRTSTAIDINIDIGLASVIANALKAFKGVPLTDSQWSLKWRVGGDEFGVVVSAPAIYQQREVKDSEKFPDGILQGYDFGEQSQLITIINTAGGNTIKETESNGKATGSFDGIEHTMTELLAHYIWTSGTEQNPDGKWRARGEDVTPFSLGDEFTGEFGPEFP